MAATPPKSSKTTPEGALSGARLRQYQGGRTQQHYADVLGLSSSRLGNYLQGTRELGIREAKQIEVALGVPAAYFLGVIDEADRDLLMVADEKKRAFLALVGSEVLRSPGPKATAIQEARQPDSRAKKRPVRIRKTSKVA